MRVDILARAIGPLARAGHAARSAALAGQAETDAQSITEPGTRADALADLAHSMAKAGQHQRAVAIARDVILTAREQAGRKDVISGLAGVVLALTEAGQHERAQDIIQAVKALREPVPVLIGIAQALAEKDHLQQAAAIVRNAMTLASMVTDPDWHAQNLADAAMVLAKAGDTPAASQATAACALTEWTTAARPAVLLDPSAFTQVAATLVALRGPVPAEPLAHPRHIVGP
jgi:hypothetical protein